MIRNKRATQAIEILESARDLAEKLDDDSDHHCKTKVYASLAISYDLAEKNSDAVNYAKKALEFNNEKALHPKDLEKLSKILRKNIEWLT